MAKPVKNYKKALKAAMNALVDLKGQTVAMHLALATADYDKIDDISDEILLELITNYVSLHEMYDHGYLAGVEDFPETFEEDDEEEDDF